MVGTILLSLKFQNTDGRYNMDTDVSHEVDKRLDELDSRITALEGGQSDAPPEDEDEDEGLPGGPREEDEAE